MAEMVSRRGLLKRASAGILGGAIAATVPAIADANLTTCGEGETLHRVFLRTSLCERSRRLLVAWSTPGPLGLCCLDAEGWELVQDLEDGSMLDLTGPPPPCYVSLGPDVEYKVLRVAAADSIEASEARADADRRAHQGGKWFEGGVILADALPAMVALKLRAPDDDIGVARIAKGISLRSSSEDAQWRLRIGWGWSGWVVTEAHRISV